MAHLTTIGARKLLDGQIKNPLVGYFRVRVVNIRHEKATWWAPWSRMVRRVSLQLELAEAPNKPSLAILCDPVDMEAGAALSLDVHTLEVPIEVAYPWDEDK